MVDENFQRCLDLIEERMGIVLRESHRIKAAERTLQAAMQLAQVTDFVQLHRNARCLYRKPAARCGTT